MTLPSLLSLVPPAQMQGQIVNGVIFVALAAVAIFAVCRSSRRS